MTPSQKVAAAARTEGIHIPEQVCPRCDGAARVPLEPFLLLVWHALHEKEGQTIHELATKCCDTAPALKYRLILLQARGLARVGGHRPAPKRGKPQPLWVRATPEAK